MMRLGLLLLVALSMAGCPSQRPLPLRPITVQVVDQATGRPLEGVAVYYSLHTKVVQKYVFFVIPSLEPDIGPKLAYKARAITDQHGEARFHARDFVLPSNERFEMESIVVNIDVDMTTRAAEISKRSLEVYYAEGRVRREGPVDNIDLVQRYLVGDRKTRDEAFVRPNPNYSGAVVRSRVYPPYTKGEVSDWFEKGEHYSLTYAGDSLEKDEDVIGVSLTPVKNE